MALAWRKSFFVTRLSKLIKSNSLVAFSSLILISFLKSSEITFTVEKNHKNYFKEKCYFKKIELISKASGFLGSCKEYLKNTAKSLEEINISDKEISNLMKIL